MRQECVPEVAGESTVNAYENGEKMCLEGPDDTFRCIAEMNIWGQKLESRFPYLRDDSEIFFACFFVKHL